MRTKPVYAVTRTARHVRLTIEASIEYSDDFRGVGEVFAAGDLKEIQAAVEAAINRAADRRGIKLPRITGTLGVKFARPSQKGR